MTLVLIYLVNGVIKNAQEILYLKVVTRKVKKNIAITIALEYLKYKKFLDDPIANPSLASNNMLQKLPPILIICGDEEVIRNDSV